MLGCRIDGCSGKEVPIAQWQGSGEGVQRRLALRQLVRKMQFMFLAPLAWASPPWTPELHNWVAWRFHGIRVGHAQGTRQLTLR